MTSTMMRGILTSCRNRIPTTSGAIPLSPGITRERAFSYHIREFSSSSSLDSSSLLKSKPKSYARVVVIGSGRMGTIRTRLVNANPKFELVGIVDPEFDGAVALADTYRVTPYSSLQDVMNDNDNNGASLPIDGLIVCTPTFTHKDIINEACEYGIDLFVEKPVGETAKEIGQLFEIAKSAKINICCGFQRRFDVSYKQMADTIRNDENNTIGTPLYSNIFFADHPVPPKSFLLTGGNIFMDLAAHDVDFIMHTLNDDIVTRVYATGTSSDGELAAVGVHDNATMVMTFSKGTIVTLYMSRSATYGYDQRCEIFGSKGLISINNIHETSTIVSDITGIHQSRLQHSFPQRFNDAFGVELDAFADTLLYSAIDEKERPPHAMWPISAEQCIKVQNVVDAARESCELGQAVDVSY